MRWRLERSTSLVEGEIAKEMFEVSLFDLVVPILTEMPVCVS